jgi:hypothetical protein
MPKKDHCHPENVAKTFRILKFTMTAMALAFCAIPAAADESLTGAYEALGKAKDWEVIRWNASGDKVCAIRTEAKPITADIGVKSSRDLRGDAVAFLTREPGSESYVFSYMPGGRVETGETGAMLVIEGEHGIALIGVRDTFYVHPSQDRVVQTAFREGRSARIEGMLPGVGSIVDEISLMGVISSTNLLNQSDC